MNEQSSPKRIAILGATSQIARDLIISFSGSEDKHLYLFARRPEVVVKWLVLVGLSGRYPVESYSGFAKVEFDAVINFVGVGNPAQAIAMGDSILEITLKYDMLVLNYLQQHPGCRYLFLSSGAVYGSDFDKPVDENSKAIISINQLQAQDWYAIAKLYAECRHRALSHLPIVDIRVFNYFSHTQDVSARFLITDVLRAIQFGDTLTTSSANIVRDYIGPEDFSQLVELILTEPAVNDVVDCYTKAPVDKMTLLSSMSQNFGLLYEVKQIPVGLNATGVKMNYFSKNRRAKKFKYSPAKSSLESILSEAYRMVSGWK